MFLHFKKKSPLSYRFMTIIKPIDTTKLINKNDIYDVLFSLPPKAKPYDAPIDHNLKICIDKIDQYFSALERKVENFDHEHNTYYGYTDNQKANE